MDGLGSLVMVALEVVFYVTNNWRYTTCQSKDDVDDDQDAQEQHPEDEEGSGGSLT